ncbi:hypothetical protein BCR43DRAFT_494578 [Syncephalastrum racemosum]|uniref:RRM domain-containing protein n=1 Tax=Syncephalastrum racemosum TaxID=13706 RepID=A0A1X2H876_SYNRA|nr:hypothetical protein BCR43DRAFT_494578 [Syncephalastrum racemosum]
MKRFSQDYPSDSQYSPYEPDMKRYAWDRNMSHDQSQGGYGGYNPYPSQGNNAYASQSNPPLPPPVRNDYSYGQYNSHDAGYGNRPHVQNEPSMPPSRNFGGHGHGHGHGRGGGHANNRGGGPMRGPRRGFNKRPQSHRPAPYHDNHAPPPPAAPHHHHNQPNPRSMRASYRQTDPRIQSNQTSFNDYEVNRPATGRAAGGRWEERRSQNYQEDAPPRHAFHEPRQVENSALPAHIESRLAREKPCRTLFVRNVQYEIRADEIRDMFAEFGEIKDVFDLIEGRGMIFVTFYDIRAAEAAKNNTQGMILADRKIDVHYSLPKAEEEDQKCDGSKNQGTLLFTLKYTDITIDDDSLYNYLRRFGDIKVIRTPHFKHHTENNERRQRFVEFYDSRACLAAYNQCHLQPYPEGGRWDLSFFWDHTNRERNEVFKKSGSVERKERPFDNDRNDRHEGRAGRRFSGGSFEGRGRNFDDRRPFPRNRDRSKDSFGHGSAHGRAQGRGQGRSDRDEFGRVLRGGRDDSRPSYDDDANSYNPEEPRIEIKDEGRLEQAQKAQQLMNMFAQQQTPTPPTAAAPNPIAVSMPQLPQAPVKLEQPAAPVNYEQTVLQQPLQPPLPQPPAPAANAAVQPPPNQAAQVQQLLGLLTQAAAQQQQQQQQAQAQASPVVQQQPIQAAQVAPQLQNQQPAAGAANALSQLTQFLQMQQQMQSPQQAVQQQQQQPPAPVSQGQEHHQQQQ